jgi:hypothetical protein
MVKNNFLKDCETPNIYYVLKAICTISLLGFGLRLQVPFGFVQAKAIIYAKF